MSAPSKPASSGPVGSSLSALAAPPEPTPDTADALPCAWTQAKSQLLDVLARLNIATASIAYDGVSDSGQTEFTSATSIDGQHVDVNAVMALGDESIVLNRLLDDFAWLVLGELHDGAWNNDGCFGTFTVDVAGRTIELEHYDRYVETNLTSTEL